MNMQQNRNNRRLVFLKAFTILTGFIILLSSCVSPGIVISDNPPPEHMEYIGQRLEELLDSNDPDHMVQAGVLVSREISRGRLEAEDARLYLQRIVQGFERALVSGSSSPEIETQPTETPDTSEDSADDSAATETRTETQTDTRTESTTAQEIERQQLRIENLQALLEFSRLIGASEESLHLSGELTGDLKDTLSFQGSGGAEFGGETSGEFLFRKAEAYRRAGSFSQALHTLYRAYSELGAAWFRDARVSQEALEWYAEQARIFNNRELLAMLVRSIEANYALDEAGESRMDGYRTFISSPWQASTGVSASVTVWVDKGLRVQNRVGVPERSIGTGFYVDPRGYIITNYHVIESEVDPEYEGKSELFVRPGNNPQLRIPARVVGYDAVFDIALLKAETDAPEVLSFQSSSILNPGSPLYAVGSPGGLENTVTSGIVSAGGRRFLQLGDSLQIDAPINPGNSGGPLFDREGRLVGVVFAGIEQFEGVNFAIPSDWIHLFFSRLFSQGAVEHPWLGVSLQKHPRGLEVLYVAPGSPAMEAGFKVGEIISSIDGRAVSGISEAQELILQETVGRLHVVQVLSGNGDRLTRLVQSRVRPEVPLENVLDDQLVDSWLPPLFGIRVEAVDSRALRSEYIITRVYPGSIADESGISENDPFELLDWYIDRDQDVAVLQIFIQKRSGGYLREGIQLANYIEINSFL